MHLNILEEARRITFAYCIENNLPLPSGPRPTHDELAPYIARVRQAARDVAGIAEERT